MSKGILCSMVALLTLGNLVCGQVSRPELFPQSTNMREQPYYQEPPRYLPPSDYQEPPRYLPPSNPAAGNGGVRPTKYNEPAYPLPMPSGGSQPAPTQHGPAHVGPTYDSPDDMFTSSGGCNGRCLDYLGEDCFDPDAKLWFTGEYLLWRVRDGRVPPLVTTGSLGDPVPGAIGQPATRVLNSDAVDLGWHSGARFNFGAWITQNWAVEGTYMFLTSQRTQSTFNSDGGLLARPFINALTGAEAAQILGAPGFAGSLSADWHDRLQSWEANVFWGACNSNQSGIQILSGFRALQLHESLTVNTHSNFAPPGGPLPPGSSVAMSDDFAMHNYFYGGQLGLRGQWRFGRVGLNACGKCALGRMYQRADLNGYTLVTTPGTSGTAGAGFLIRPSNRGSFSDSEFAVVPEANVNLEFAVTANCYLTLGYSFLYASHVLRPGEQVDRSIGGSTRPAFVPIDGDFWAHGLNVGLHLQY